MEVRCVREPLANAVATEAPCEIDESPGDEPPDDVLEIGEQADEHARALGCNVVRRERPHVTVGEPLAATSRPDERRSLANALGNDVGGAFTRPHHQNHLSLGDDIIILIFGRVDDPAGETGVDRVGAGIDIRRLMRSTGYDDSVEAFCATLTR